MEAKMNLTTVDSTASHTTPIDSNFEDDNIKLIKYSNNATRNKETIA